MQKVTGIILNLVSAKFVATMDQLLLTTSVCKHVTKLWNVTMTRNGTEESVDVNVLLTVTVPKVNCSIKIIVNVKTFNVRS